MAHIIGAGDLGQRLAVRAATERLAPLVGGQLRAPAEVDPAGLRAGASLAGAGTDLVISTKSEQVLGPRVSTQREE